MQNLRAIIFATVLFSATGLIAEEFAEETIVIQKIELLGGVVERSPPPDRHVIAIRFNGDARFNKRYLRLLKQFKYLERLQLDSMAIDSDVLREIEQPRVLVNMLCERDSPLFTPIINRLRELGESGMDAVIEVSDEQISGRESSGAETDRELRAMRLCDLDIAMFKLDRTSPMFDCLKRQPDPRLRTQVIHRMAHLRVNATALYERLLIEKDSGIRAGLLLGLGDYSFYSFSKPLQEGLQLELPRVFFEDSDPGVHSAAEWLMNQWKLQFPWGIVDHMEKLSKLEVRERRLNEITENLKKPDPQCGPQWFVNSQEQTMIVIPGPVKFLMGSPATEIGRDADETQHEVEIKGSFALSAIPVTAEQFRSSSPSYSQEVDPRVSIGNAPAVRIDWYGAARYCNWLSEQEGLPPYYDIEEVEDGDDKVWIRENSASNDGYRLPTEAEMEYAIRAGTTTSRPSGVTTELLHKYSWFRLNSGQVLHDPWELKPNDLGLFDGLGNVLTWCEDEYRERHDARQLAQQRVLIDPKVTRSLRGGAFDHDVAFIRSAVRYNMQPNYQSEDTGFRVARTIKVNAGGVATPRRTE